MDDRNLSCTDCKARTCENDKDGVYPAFCITKKLDENLIKETVDTYSDNSSLDSKISKISAEIEGEYYGRLTRVEETVMFAKKLGAKKVGIATCIGLLNEADAFAKVLKANGIDYTGISCKAGAQDKSLMGLSEDKKIRPGGYEPMCNPMLQAKFLNSEKTDLNIVIGLCVGHDSIFMRHSEAPATTLIAKDRVLGHNPAACLYNIDSYYGKLKEPIKE